MRLLSAGLFVGAILVSATAAGAQDIDWEKVDAALGRKGAVSADVHRYGFPRSDLTVKLDGVTIKPALALGGWVAFKPMHGEVMVMGDLVLLETEINPVMAKLIENGIEITAVHNHLLRANPATVLHARRRTRRPGQDGDRRPHRAGGKQDATGRASGRSRAAAGHRSRHRAAR